MCVSGLLSRTGPCVCVSGLLEAWAELAGRSPASGAQGSLPSLPSSVLTAAFGDLVWTEKTHDLFIWLPQVLTAVHRIQCCVAPSTRAPLALACGGPGPSQRLFLVTEADFLARWITRSPPGGMFDLLNLGSVAGWGRHGGDEGVADDLKGDSACLPVGGTGCLVSQPFLLR